MKFLPLTPSDCLLAVLSALSPISPSQGLIWVSTFFRSVPARTYTLPPPLVGPFGSATHLFSSVPILSYRPCDDAAGPFPATLPSRRPVLICPLSFHTFLNFHFSFAPLFLLTTFQHHVCACSLSTLPFSVFLFSFLRRITDPAVPTSTSSFPLCPL